MILQMRVKVKNKNPKLVSWKTYYCVRDFLDVLYSKLDLASREDFDRVGNTVQIKIEPDDAHKQKIKTMPWLSSNKKYKKYF